MEKVQNAFIYTYKINFGYYTHSCTYPTKYTGPFENPGRYQLLKNYPGQLRTPQKVGHVLVKQDGWQR